MVTSLNNQMIYLEATIAPENEGEILERSTEGEPQILFANRAQILSSAILIVALKKNQAVLRAPARAGASGWLVGLVCRVGRPEAGSPEPAASGILTHTQLVTLKGYGVGGLQVAAQQGAAAAASGPESL